MKLKKIASLLLAGVMAVSMLTACGEGSSNSNSSSAVVTPAASDAVKFMNDGQDKVPFASDAEFVSALEKAVKKATFNDVKAAKYNIAYKSTGNVADELNKILDVGASVFGNETYVWFNGNAEHAAAGKSAVLTGLWIVESYGLSEEAALKNIVDKMKANGTYPETVTIDGKIYPASYTGKIAIVKGESEDGGKTEEAYFIAMSVEETVSRDFLTNNSKS